MIGLILLTLSLVVFAIFVLIRIKIKISCIEDSLWSLQAKLYANRDDRLKSV